MIALLLASQAMRCAALTLSKVDTPGERCAALFPSNPTPQHIPRHVTEKAQSCCLRGTGQCNTQLDSVTPALRRRFSHLPSLTSTTGSFETFSDETFMFDGPVYGIDMKQFRMTALVTIEIFVRCTHLQRNSGRGSKDRQAVHHHPCGIFAAFERLRLRSIPSRGRSHQI